MIEPRMPQEIAYASRHARLLVPCTEHEATQTRKHDRTRTHRAWLERHNECAIVETPPAQQSRRLTKCQQLGVRGRILITRGSIRRAYENGAVVEHAGADWHLASHRTLGGGGERLTHPLFVVQSIDRQSL